MIQQQTFELQCNEEELLMIAEALNLLAEKRYTDAAAVLIKRHDQLTRAPKLKLYDPREART